MTLGIDGITTIRVNRRAFRQVQLDRNRRMYHFLLSVCQLLHESILVSEDSGDVRFQDFRKDQERMWRVFEDFVTEFYKREQHTYRVRGNRRSRGTTRGRRWSPTRGAFRS